MELRTLTVLSAELPQRIELGFDRLAKPRAVLPLVLLERLHVGIERVATRREVLDLALESRAFVLGDPPCGPFRLGHELPGLGLGFLEQRARPLLRFRDRLVGGLLREHERALQHLFGLAALARASFDGLKTFGQLTNALAQPFDRRCGALEQLVDVVTVVTAESLPDVGVPEFTRSYIHDTPCYRAGRRMWETLTAPFRRFGLEGADDPLDDEQHEEDHHERQVEHADGRDDAPEWSQHRLREIRQEGRDRHQRAPRANRKPRQDRTRREQDEIDAQHPADELHCVRPDTGRAPAGAPCPPPRPRRRWGSGGTPARPPSASSRPPRTRDHSRSR